MNATLRDHPSYRLTRHFFRGLFDLGFLSDEGSASYERMIAGVLAVFLSFGLLIARVFMAQTASLSALDTPEPYRMALLAGHAFMMALPMWIVAFVTILVSHSLFPDETDFRVLVPLPIPQKTIFATKLLALTLFIGLFVIGTHTALIPLFLMTAFSRWARHAVALQALAFLFASILGSLFAAFAITAINGALVTCLPRTRFAAATATLRSAMLCLLVLALPLVSRLTATGHGFAAHSGWLLLAPPAWFVGLERLLLGESASYSIRLAIIAVSALAVALLIACASYVMLYRHFDRVMARPVEGAAPTFSLFRFEGRSFTRRAGSFVAVRQFTMRTLRRSALHQGIFVTLAAAGLGLVLNGLLLNDVLGWLRNGGLPRTRLVASMTWAPFVLIYTLSLAVRASLVVPIEQRANWVFRMTERGDTRCDQLEAVVQTVKRLGVALPVVLLLPLQWLAIGPSALLAAVVALLCGSVFVELLLAGWQRIPFTSAYIPGKRFVPQSLLIGFVTFVLFTTIGSGLVGVSLMRPSSSLWIIAVLAGTILRLRTTRRRRSHTHPLAFEDQPPADVQVLGLTG